MVKPWVFEFFHASPEVQAGRTRVVAYFDAYLDLWARAEELGFEGLFMSEHHFGLGYSPSPNLLLPLIAKRTRRLRLGVLGMIVPYHSPWRLAEEVRMLDALTAGRLEIGTSAGAPLEFERLGMTTQEARARYDEALEILDASLGADTISHKGAYWNFENLALAPPLVQQPPPMWTTVISIESARKAARRGSKIATGFVPTEKAREIFDAYNEEATKAGTPAGPERLGLRRQVIVREDAAAAAEQSSAYASMFGGALTTHDKRVIAPGRPALDAPGAHAYALGDDEFIGGTPQQVAEQVAAQCEASGAGHFQAIFADNHTIEDVARSWELFGQGVIPALRDA